MELGMEDKSSNNKIPDSLDWVLICDHSVEKSSSSTKVGWDFSF